MVWLGIALIIIAVGLIVGELFTGSGILLAVGIASLVFGLIVLLTEGTVFAQVNWWLVAPLIVLVIGLITFIILRILNTYRRKAVTGKEDLEGKTAVVKETLDPEGTVLFDGEYWNAVSISGKIQTGEEVIIERVEGLKLYVAKKIPDVKIQKT